MSYELWKTQKPDSSEPGFIIFNREKSTPFCFLNGQQVAIFSEHDLFELKNVLDILFSGKNDKGFIESPRENPATFPEQEAIIPADLTDIKLTDKTASVILALKNADILTDSEAEDFEQLLKTFIGETTTLEDLYQSLTYSKAKANGGKEKYCPNSSALALLLYRRGKMRERLLDFLCPSCIDYLNSYKDKDFNEIIPDGEYVEYNSDEPYCNIGRPESEHISLRTCGEVATTGFVHKDSHYSIKLYNYMKNRIWHSKTNYRNSNARLVVRILYLMISENT